MQYAGLLRYSIYTFNSLYYALYLSVHYSCSNTTFSLDQVVAWASIYRNKQLLTVSTLYVERCLIEHTTLHFIACIMSEICRLVPRNRAKMGGGGGGEK